MKEPLNSYPLETQLQVGKMLLKMKQLNFEAGFSSVVEGPILRTFYYQPTLSALYSKIMSKDDEIAGILGVESVRIYRQNALLAIEVPRTDRQLIRFDMCLHQMLQSPETREMALPLLMGQSPTGQYLYADIASQPHLFIAGSTGSGKSVFTSQLISSLALFRSARELEFTLVDTKNLDLVLFRGLKHIRVVITDVAVLRTHLEDALKEVRRRTRLMSGLARNTKEWNTQSFGEFLPYRVLIIDELADVMMTDSSLRSGMDREERVANPSIASLLSQLAQIARAAGIHIVCATQRPSVKMVTGDSRIGFGDIKANFPARICFLLPTMADSRVVLDENGAERLLGKGDYLYKLNGSDSLLRAHSAYVSSNDIALILSQHNEIRRMYATV
jgi:S-DNA-T family DNA segregation ATPase FtsK/SpoIIIE